VSWPSPVTSRSGSGWGSAHANPTGRSIRLPEAVRRHAGDLDEDDDGRDGELLGAPVVAPLVDVRDIGLGYPGPHHSAGRDSGVYSTSPTSATISSLRGAPLSDQLGLEMVLVWLPSWWSRGTFPRFDGREGWWPAGALGDVGRRWPWARSVPDLYRVCVGMAWAWRRSDLGALPAPQGVRVGWSQRLFGFSTRWPSCR
jgi:hypothetical protein